MLRVERVAAGSKSSVGVWTIDRPAAKNALDHATLEALVLAVNAASTDTSLRAVVLTGAGDAFVSGGDLRELRDRNAPEDAARFSDLGWDLTQAVAALPFPVVCAMPGVAIGGGAELALACDMRVADARASLAFKQVRMGVTTAWGTVPRLVALVGPGAAMRLLTTAETISAEAARAIGLVDEVTESGNATAVAIAWATKIAEAAPSAIAGMKRLVQASAATSHDVRALERSLFVETWSGADHAEAVAAYFERRAPRWRGA